MNPPALTLDHRGLVVRPAPNPAPQGPFTTASLLNYGLAHHPQRLALVHDQTEYSWQALADRVNAAAGGLTSLGIRPGDRVVARMANGPALVEAFLATQQLGALWLGINPNLSDDEACWMMDDAQASLVLTDPDRPVGNRPSLCLPQWQDLLAAGHPAPETLIDPHAPAAIAYTSGTTGRPKGAVHSQHNLLWPGVSTRTLYPPLLNERNGTALALTVLNMMILGPVSAFARGTTTVILNPGPAASIAQGIEKTKINRLLMVPTQIHDMVHDPKITAQQLSSLSQVIVGAGPTPPELRQAWQDKFGFPCTMGYGLSEAPSGVVRQRHDAPQADGNGAGQALDPVVLHILDDNDLPLAAGQTGEVCIGPQTTGPWAGVWTPMLGYWNQPQSTQKALRCGLLHTGDLGYLDQDGLLTLQGRRSDLILRGGANVYPTEVERVLLTYPGVDQVIVLGLPDERLGQRVAAALVADPNLDLEDLAKFAGQKLASYKVPDTWRIVEHFERNTMGKIIRSRVAELFN